MQPAASKTGCRLRLILQALLRLQNLYGEDLFIRTRKAISPVHKGKIAPPCIFAKVLNL